jgi:hypothetical protein
MFGTALMTDELVNTTRTQQGRNWPCDKDSTKCCVIISAALYRVVASSVLTCWTIANPFSVDDLTTTSYE